MDPRIELIAAVESLSLGNPCPARENSRYLERILRSLDRGHPACKLFSRMTAKDWRHRHPSLILLDFGPLPALEVAAHQDHYGDQGRSDALARFMPALRDFASRGFMEFFSREGNFYGALIESLGSRLEGLDYLSPLQEYLGLNLPHRYHFLISPLYHDANRHNVLYAREDKICDIYSISGHLRISGGEPDLDYSPEDFAHTAWHEISHTVIDAITQSFREQLSPLSPLDGLMTGIAKGQYRGPQGWLHMVDEHVIRAITSRLEALTAGEESGRGALKKEKENGFALVGPVYELLLEYEKSRGRYPSITQFYPRIVELFRKLYAEVRLMAGWKAA